MKRFVLLLILVPLGFTVMGQKIIVDKVDAFTKAHIIETSMEKIVQKRQKFTGEISARIEIAVRSVDGNIVLPCNIYKTPMSKYDENSGLMILFENGDTANLKTLYTGVGGDSWKNGYWKNNWFKTVLEVDKKDLDNLSDQKITIIRLNYFGASQDFQIKGKESEMIKNMMKLVMPND